ncbi:anthranilate phosphoribosyltransferase [Anaerolentibacter hominis]|uniref:anthranilate phosphoribosyltransferase n=1 Tax=Anaerolentibacter hominis TaxID=3079009 RepID=UPI0031B8B0EA
MIQQAIYEVVNGHDLDFDTMKTVMGEMMDGTATQAQMGGLLTAMRLKGETVDEITACAAVMREKGIKINPVREVIDIVGTGGDEVGTFNISTTTAFIVAAGGVQVAKHGNRSVSSKSGAADVLEKLGIRIDLTPEQCEKVLDETGMCFMFAQLYHSSMKYAAPVRRELGARTIFNILGPLSNPAGATMQLMGVYDRKLIEPLAQVLSNLGVVRGLAVCGGDGLDEITLTGESHLCEIRYGKLNSYDITPEQFGLKRCELSDLIGGTAHENAQITLEILKGKERGPKRDVVVLNAAMGLYLGIDNCTVEDCVKMAQELIDSGAAYKKYLEFKEATNQIS